MSKKYVIEIKPEFEDSFKGVMILGAKDSNLFVDTLVVENLEELNSDYINEHFGELQDTAYQRGLEEGKKAFDLLESERDSEYQRGLDDAWEAARKVVLSPDEGGTSLPTLFAIFGSGSMQHVFRNFSASVTIAKLKAYEQKRSDKIKRGDIVNVDGCCNDNLLGVVTKVWEDNCYIMWGDGSGGAWCKDSVVKTGKHIDIDKILEELRYDS